MDSDIVTIGWYGLPLEARLDAALLEAHGIPAIVMTDDAGGMLPSLQVLADTRLAVRASDAEAARLLLLPGDGTDSLFHSDIIVSS